MSMWRRPALRELAGLWLGLAAGRAPSKWKGSLARSRRRATDGAARARFAEHRANRSDCDRRQFTLGNRAEHQHLGAAQAA